MKVTQEQYDTLTKSVEHWRRAVAGKLELLFLESLLAECEVVP